MKKRLTSMVMALFVACSLIVPVGAVDSPECMEITPIAQDEMVINDADFLANATVSTKALGNDVYAVELYNPNDLSIDSKTGKHVRTVATLVAFDKDELTAIEQNVQAATRSIATKPKDNGWADFGSSLYLQSIISYDIKYTSSDTLYKMSSVQVKYQVRNGTSCKSRSVKFVCNMALHNTGDVPVSIASSAKNPCTVNAPSAWPYLSQEGLRYGVFFYCTVQRPSGETKQCSLYNDVFG